MEQPFYAGDLVIPDPLYFQEAKWKFAKIIGCHYYDSVDGKWTVDIQRMKKDEHGNFVYTTVFDYMLCAWEVSKITEGK